MNITLESYQQLIILGLGFAVICIAASRIAPVFQKVNLPIITGFLATGVLAGPYLLGLIPKESTQQLNFINEIALAFIAFAAGSELYLRELHARIRSIKWNTISQLVFTFAFGALSAFFLSDLLPFTQGVDFSTKLSISLLIGAIFVARSPTSAIAIISELRAKGPLTQTVLGVIVLTDFFVIILFAVCMSFAVSLTSGSSFNYISILILIVEIAVSLGVGFLLGKVLNFVISFRIRRYAKSVLIIGLGYMVYLLKFYIQDLTDGFMEHPFTIEPLIICIIASFYVANYTKNRPEFLSILDKTFPLIYAAFFTLTGASLSLYALFDASLVALLFFVVRLFAIIAGNYFGGAMAEDPWPQIHLSWMPYVTQAGVALGLTAVVSNEFPTFGPDFAAFIIAIVVINEIVGPPLFKYAITKAGENRNKGSFKFDGVRDAIIFGYESQSVSLAQQLMKSGWKVQIATRKKPEEIEVPDDIILKHIECVDLSTLKAMHADKSEAIVCLMSDRRNLEACELAYKHFGTPDMIVRLGDRSYYDKFLALGARVVDPSTAIVSLLDHYVRSPQATSLLLGMQPGQDTRDMELKEPSLHGLTLRDLRLPSDVLILSIHRAGQMIISHGFTRLRVGDVVTFVGSTESLDAMQLKFDHY
ncbi:monovalent cation:proton antiporter family protein [Reichenbachiella agariperforans]|uniref:monovalent cation:proton antiporter family protein n=1 Tax=Reichenbachiella agariperforans TaxID=156994 RepID=UPI001C0834D2|nr:cation:proton antiporter [Reichenbachiella agariperforans]MBU2915621.1 cation:proton antiporter [Reichenbachiella agariperforans]